MSPSPPTPVLILGITRRSGTNFLYRLLLEHPDCLPARQPGEDFLAHGAHHLARYVDEVARRWNPDWNPRGQRAADLAHSLGRGWLEHLRPEGEPVAFVSKTPSIRGIAHVHRFLPEARVLALVRDGRDVVESGVQGFGWTYGEGFRLWRDAAQELAAFLERDRGSRLSVVRFESLVREPAAELGRVFEACGLDPERFEHAAARELPVYGSSSLTDGRGQVHWNPVPRPEGFDPVGRWSGWDDTLRLRYDRVCGEAAERLGYPRHPEPRRRLQRGATRLAAFLDRR